MCGHMDLIDSPTSRILAKAMDGTAMRHTAIASNIANADTPGYKAMAVSFEEDLKRAITQDNSHSSGTSSAGVLKATNPAHANAKHFFATQGSSQPEIERSKFLYRYDKNGVDIEKSMADLAKNSGRYAALGRLESKYFNSMRSIIRGSGGS